MLSLITLLRMALGGDFGRGRGIKTLLWEGGVYLEEGERLQRKGKLCCFYNLPPEAAFSCLVPPSPVKLGSPASSHAVLVEH